MTSWVISGMRLDFSMSVAQRAWSAVGWIWNEHGEWLLPKPSIPYGLLENPKSKKIQLALFEKIQFLYFLKLKTHDYMIKTHFFQLLNGSISLELREKDQMNKKIT